MFLAILHVDRPGRFQVFFERGEKVKFIGIINNPTEDQLTLVSDAVEGWKKDHNHFYGTPHDYREGCGFAADQGGGSWTTVSGNFSGFQVDDSQIIVVLNGSRHGVQSAYLTQLLDGQWPSEQVEILLYDSWRNVVAPWEKGLKPEPVDPFDGYEALVKPVRKPKWRKKG